MFQDLIMCSIVRYNFFELLQHCLSTSHVSLCGDGAEWPLIKPQIKKVDTG